tara:strand:+ start:30 stop:305 length:276 start_codon:yes stop_codon:yes gene_type:complete
VIRDKDQDFAHWSSEASKFNTYKERIQFLLDQGFSQERADTLEYLSVYWMPKRVYRFESKYLNAMYKDLKHHNQKIAFKVGVHKLRKKYGI